MRAVIFVLSGLLAGVLVFQCSKSTVAVAGTWSDPAYETGKVEKILVVGASPKEQARKEFERQLRDRINKGSKAEAEASLSTISTGEALNRETFEKFFSGKGFDAVVVTRVVDAQEAANFKPGDNYTMADPNYNDFYSYYRNKIVKVPDSGGFEYGRLSQVETLMYETGEGKLIWHCVTKAFDEGDTLKVIDDLVKTIVDKMKEDRLIR